MATQTTPFVRHLCVSSRLQRRYARYISGFAMRALPPPLRTIAANRIATVHRRSSISAVDGIVSKLVAMAEEEGEPKTKGSEESPLKEEEEEKKEVKLPPPPEKPLPGDCCGNGCVPCVWDTYYEELEDYNKLIANSKS